MTTSTAQAGTLQPQDWHEVGSPPPRLAQAAGAIAGRYGTGVLGPGELCELVTSLAPMTALWEPLLVCDAARRRYRLLFEDRRLDIWVLSWMPGQATGYHDHGISNVALTALQGSVLEQQIRLGGRTSGASFAPARCSPARPATSTPSRTSRGGLPQRCTPTPRPCSRLASTGPDRQGSWSASRSMAAASCSTTPCEANNRHIKCRI